MPQILFSAPSIKRYETSEFKPEGNSFFAVSITGSACGLKCSHCLGKILSYMKATTTKESLYRFAKGLYSRGGKGLLVSGGSNRNGVVPMRPFLKTLEKIKREFNFKLVAHIGILDKETVAEIKESGIDRVMIDIVGSEDTLRDVCHQKREMADFEETLSILCKYELKVVPHIVIGLDFGKIKGEFNALKLVCKYPIYSLVLVGILPLLSTPMYGIKPPSPEEMKDVFIRARELFPDKPVMLGCTRPMGPHKIKTDIFALSAGLNGIAYPSEGIVSRARDMGYEPQFSEVCCSLYEP
ncbi:MAG: radical SAM protein [bacterium]